MSTIKRLRDRIFAREDMDGGGVCPVYLTRWTLWRRGPIAVYLHWFRFSDWAVDLHDHPKRFVSIGLKGEYTEVSGQGCTTYRAPWIRTFSAEHAHRVVLDEGKTAWTICITGPRRRDWGFWLKGRWVHWQEYVQKYGDIRRSC